MKKPISLQLLFIYMYLFYFKSSVIDIYYIKTIWFYNKAPLKKVVWLSSNARPNFWKLEKKITVQNRDVSFQAIAWIQAFIHL